jgi:murein DD-endopeptidase MepM/ murein hydrolase activator NlpD
MYKPRWLSMALTVLMLLVMIMPVYADELSNQQDILDEINQKLDQQQNNLNQATKTEKSIMGQVRNIESQVNQTEADITNLENRIAFLQNNIKTTEKQVAQQQKELDKQTKMLADRLVIIYEQGESSYLQVLLGANDIRDFITRYDMLSTIVMQDQDLIDSINGKKQDLDNKLADLEVQKRELVAAQDSKEGKKAQLAGQLNDKKNVLNSVQSEKESYAQAVEELEQASAEAQAIILRLQGKNPGSAMGTGKFTWPTPGYRTITSPYGMRYHPILKTNKLHTGEDIGAPMGASIVAADAGSVIFAGWLGAYGNAIIIDHGNGLSTLYGHQSQLLVSVGQTVAKGQTIGKVGSTGWSTGPHLHFEVRKNGSPVSPAAYV